MILKAEGNLAQISRAVHDQGRKIKETSWLELFFLYRNIALFFFL
jgi:hypothetical protein